VPSTRPVSAVSHPRSAQSFRPDWGWKLSDVGATFEHMSTTSRKSRRHPPAPAASPGDQRQSLIGIADLPPTEFAHALARLFVPRGTPIRPEDARWIEDVEYIETVRKRDLKELSDGELLNLISAQVRVADRAAVHTKELTVISKAGGVVHSPRSPGSAATIEAAASQPATG
jgi:hypothetical protein